MQLHVGAVLWIIICLFVKINWKQAKTKPSATTFDVAHKSIKTWPRWILFFLE